MAEIPKKIQVGPYVYKVKATTEALHERNKHDNCSLQGHCSYLDHEITIDPTAPLDRRRVALFHEAAHACCEVVHLFGKFDDEEFVRRLAPALVDLLRRNPQLVAFLTEAEDG